MTLGAIGILAAGVFWARQYPDAAFVAATLGVVAWFLSYRVQMKSILSANEREYDKGEDSSEHIDN